MRGAVERIREELTKGLRRLQEIPDRLRMLKPSPSGEAGRLLQRDYWAVIKGSRARPREVMELVAARFSEFAPSELAAFRRTAGEGPLAVGDVLEVHIRATGTYRVRVTHCDENSFTLTTLPGHPESGRITFGAYPNELGDVIFHIRSRARSGSVGHYLGFVAVGEAMQTETWAEFVNRVALTVGDGVLAFVHAERRALPMRGWAAERANGPTFIARGG